MENKRIAEIDYIRGFAIFLVVLGHAIIVYPIDLHQITWCKYLFDLIYSFHMPLFFAISGYCYTFNKDGGGTLDIFRIKQKGFCYHIFSSRLLQLLLNLLCRDLSIDDKE